MQGRPQDLAADALRRAADGAFTAETSKLAAEFRAKDYGENICFGAPSIGGLECLSSWYRQILRTPAQRGEVTEYDAETASYTQAGAGGRGLGAPSMCGGAPAMCLSVGVACIGVRRLSYGRL